MVLTRATIVFLDDRRITTKNPEELANLLREACAAERNVNPIRPGHLFATGYQSLLIDVEIGGHEVTWEHRSGVFWLWGGMGNPDLTMQGHLELPAEILSKEGPKQISLPCIDGEEFGDFFSMLGVRRVVGSIRMTLNRPSPIAYDNFALLVLEPDPAGMVMAVGRVYCFRSNSLGATYRWLYELELHDPDNPDYGRGDHVGNRCRLRGYGL